MKAVLLLGGLAAIILPAAQASAQDNGTTRVRIGLGPQFTPEYPGSDDNELGPLVDFSIARNGEPFEFSAPDDSFDIELIESGGFSFGPVLNYVGSRKNSDVGAPVGKVKATIEAGGFAEYEVSDSFRLRAELRKGLGGHKGLIGSLGGDYVARDGDNYVFSIGPRLLISDSKYQEAYFGVTPAASLLTGLPVYDPDGGIHGVAATSSLYYSFNPTWGMFGYARLERLVGDAKNSPIVEEFGSPTQFSGGIGITYTFNVN